jgi:hypothetical protein
VKAGSFYIETAFPIRAFLVPGIVPVGGSLGRPPRTGVKVCLGQHGDYTIEDSDGDDEDADKRLVSVLHTNELLQQFTIRLIIPG